MLTVRSSLIPIACFCLLTSCGDAIDEGGQIDGELSEWSIDMDDSNAKAGEITFRIKNAGTIDHEFVVVKTKIPAGELLVEGGVLPEDQMEIEVIDEIPPFSVGRTEELTVNLSEGRYQLVCNLPGHFQAGMHTTFIVK